MSALVHDLDIEQPAHLIHYLRERGRIGAQEEPLCRTLAGGVSNRAVWVERANGEAWVIKQALEKLRVAADWFSSPQRIHREALGIRWLEQLAPGGAITPLVFEDHEYHLLAMQAVPQPHEDWKTLLMTGALNTTHIEQFGRLLGCIHRKSWTRRGELAAVFQDGSFFESLRLEPYYAASAEQVPAAAVFLQALIAHTRKRSFALVHGDYSPKNVLVYQGRLVLLDHEVIHWGDPAFDIGFALTHLLSKAHHLVQWRNEFTHAALLFWQSYRQELDEVPWAQNLEPFAVRHTLGCLLARVAGNSPLEYLDAEEKARQQYAVVALMADVPTTIAELTGAFIEKLGDECHESKN